MGEPKGQQRPGTLSSTPGDGKKGGGEVPNDLAGTGPTVTSTHYGPGSAPDPARPRGGNGEGVMEGALGYRSNDRSNLPTTRDVTGGRIRRISEE